MVKLALVGALWWASASAWADAHPGISRLLACNGASFCGDFVRGFEGWDGFDGDESPRGRARYFSIRTARRGAPAGSRFFRAVVDAGATDDGEPGQRTLVYLFPNEDATQGKTGAYEGANQWYHTSIYFPPSFQPSPGTVWNWLVEWHNWPDSVCCANIALTVDARGAGSRTRRRARSAPPREALSMRVMGGGDPGHPVGDYGRQAARGPGVRTRWVVGDQRLRRGHWYDVLLHVKWSYRDGLVAWWLDGRRVAVLHTPTLFWYADNNEVGDGETPGPGQAYWMMGYYRPSSRGRRGRDRTVAAVDHSGARRGPSRASVAY